jgi:hypothetical protein
VLGIDRSDADEHVPTLKKSIVKKVSCSRKKNGNFSHFISKNKTKKYKK